MSNRPSISHQKRELRRRFRIAGIVAGIVLGAFFLFFPYGLVTRTRLEWERHTIDADLSTEERVRDSLQREIHRLETDSLELERIARERYGMVRPGEEVFIVE